jgi:hypothetical protein
MDKRKRQTIQWTKEKDRQYNGQRKKTDNTMDKRKKHNHGHGQPYLIDFFLTIISFYST